MRRALQRGGFTIVELLIVVVVIAILAAITIVAYNGVTKRAAEAVAQNAVSTAQKKLATYFIENGETYPTNLASLGLTNDEGVSYQYTANNTTDPKGYCVTVTTPNGAVYYLGNSYTYINDATKTLNMAASTTGACPGHSTTGVAITNYATNPSAEINQTGFAGPNGATLYRDSSRSYTGDNSMRVTMPQAASSTVGIAFLLLTDFTTLLKPNTNYVVSAWVWVPASTADVRISIQGTGRAAGATYAERVTSVKGQWTRIYDSFTTGTSGNTHFYVLNNGATSTAGTQFWADSFMITEGTQPVTFATGNSPGWVWNGPIGLSTSSGPAL